MSIINYIIDRFKEPSTYRGIFLLLAAAGVSLAPGQADAIIAVGVALVGVFEAFKKEK